MIYLFIFVLSSGKEIFFSTRRGFKNGWMDPLRGQDGIAAL